jgi:hypothetical protein
MTFVKWSFMPDVLPSNDEDQGDFTVTHTDTNTFIF